jgi:cytochrome c oxidase assembly protein Cox11
MLKTGETASIEIDIDLSAEYSDSQRGELMAIGYFHEGVFTPITTDYCDKVTPGTIYSFTAPEAGEYFWYLENFCAVTQNLASVKVKRFFAL